MNPFEAAYRAVRSGPSRHLQNCIRPWRLLSAPCKGTPLMPKPGMYTRFGHSSTCAKGKTVILWPPAILCAPLPWLWPPQDSEEDARPAARRRQSAASDSDDLKGGAPFDDGYGSDLMGDDEDRCAAAAKLAAPRGWRGMGCAARARVAAYLAAIRGRMEHSFRPVARSYTPHPFYAGWLVCRGWKSVAQTTSGAQQPFVNSQRTHLPVHAAHVWVARNTSTLRDMHPGDHHFH